MKDENGVTLKLVVFNRNQHHYTQELYSNHITAKYNFFLSHDIHKHFFNASL